MEDESAVVKHLRLIIQDQAKIINQQHIELAEHREREHLIADCPWGFALWLLLNDVWPFSLWYHRFDGGDHAER